MELHRAVVVVTGASSGIGRATALLLARRGARLVLAARREAALEEVARACRELGAEAVAVPTDQTRPEEVQDLARKAEEAHGRLDAWINDAGVYAVGTLEATPDQVFQRVLEANLLSCVYGCRAALPLLRKQGRGVLLNVSSLLGRVGAPYLTAYTASKFGVRGLSEALRDELKGTGIEVCCVFPPSTDTPLFQHGANYSGRALQPAGPVLSPERVARAIVRCLERPRREVVVGLRANLATLAHALLPGLFEPLMKRRIEREQFLPRLQEPTSGNLFRPMATGRSASGGWRRSRAARAARVALPLLAVPVGLRLLRAAALR